MSWVDLIQFKKTQKIHGINHDKDMTYCGKSVINNAFFMDSGSDDLISCKTCSWIVEEIRRIEQYERDIYDGMTYIEYKAHLKAQSLKSMPVKAPMIHVEGPNGTKNVFVMTAERVGKLYE